MRTFQLVLITALTIGLSSAAQAQTAPESHWLASGFAGADFGKDADETAVNYGGTIGYLWRGVLGGEFHANFSPDFGLDPVRGALFLDSGSEPWIGSYMANAVGAIPLGDDGAWRPYVSGGFGVLTLRSDVIFTDGEENEFEPDDSRPGANVGLGLMGFMGNVGLRGDVRYFHGFTDDTIDSSLSFEEILREQVLSDLSFWRANIGVAFRW